MKYLPIAIGIGAIAALAFISRSASPADPAPQTSLAPQTNAEGPVTVTVAPRIAADAWEFAVTLDTHSVELTDDMTQAAQLISDSGAEYAPRSWSGDPAGGHHRSGTLTFAPPAPESAAVTLAIRNVGGVAERLFTWQNPN